MKRRLQNVVVRTAILFLGPFALQAQYLDAAHDDFRAAKKIYDRVWAAFGSNKVPPELVIRKRGAGNDGIARYVFGTGKIKPSVILDGGLIGLLQATFRDEFPTALACVFAHELAHHYHDHRQLVAFAATGKKPHLEVQADVSGFFFAYLAGYPVFSVAEKLFNVLYATYNLDRNGAPEYLPKKERVALAREQVENVKRLAHLYEAGKVLLLIGKTEEAIACLEIAETELPVQEVQHNLGLAFLLHVARKGWILASEMPFVLPFELNASERLLINARGMSANELQQKKRCLESAERLFRRALQSGASEGTVLNLAIAQLLLGKYRAAAGTIDELPNPGRDACLVRGIGFLKDGQQQKAAADFEQLTGAEEQAAAYNLGIYRQVRDKGWVKVATPEGAKAKSFRLLLRETVPENGSWMRAPITETPFRIVAGAGGAGSLYEFTLPGSGGDLTWKVLKVTATGIENRLKVPIGTEAVYLTKADALPGYGLPGYGLPGYGLPGYGLPDRVLKAAGGRSYFLYDSAQIAFILDNRKVSGWYVYERLF